MRTLRARHHFYLPDDRSAKLGTLTASPGTSKTQILTVALSAWLERKVDALTEMLGLFVRHQLTLVAHQPPFDNDTARLGQTRHLSFMKLVEQLLARTDSGEATALAKQEEQP